MTLSTKICCFIPKKMPVKLLNLELDITLKFIYYNLLTL